MALAKGALDPLPRRKYTREYDTSCTGEEAVMK